MGFEPKNKEKESFRTIFFKWVSYLKFYIIAVISFGLLGFFYDSMAVVAAVVIMLFTLLGVIIKDYFNQPFND